MMRVQRANSRESGFAMLAVFLAAAIIAIALYIELPRVVMESQRAKEQLLIDRGEQYKRGVQVFYRAFRRYPTDLDALENTNNRRFLRKRYKDPMTGEDNWRLIHVNGGVFTDSLLNQPGQTTQTASSSPGDTEQQAPAPWLQARASDRILNPSVGEAPLPADDGTAQPGVPPGTQASDPNAQQPAPGQEPTAGQPVTIMPFMAQSGIGQNQPSVSQTGPGTEDQNPATGPVAFTPNSQAAEIINRLLTSPSTVMVPGVARQGNSGPLSIPVVSSGGAAPSAQAGFAALSASASAATQQQAGGAGIAGIASQLEAEGIKVYNDRTKYNEWEFTYNVRQDPIATRMGLMNTQTAPGRGNQTGPQQQGATTQGGTPNGRGQGPNRRGGGLPPNVPGGPGGGRGGGGGFGGFGAGPGRGQ